MLLCEAKDSAAYNFSYGWYNDIKSKESLTLLTLNWYWITKKLSKLEVSFQLNVKYRMTLQSSI